ncbi:hypothetical protein [Streptacidiphilus fuscans]|uniref:Uncharacterized protein n=1 Tax=Streptacidiphilus fuscans TaxID=2789292 RepID=A0A931B9G5_9ACTN|nr:hypothetical protein [Streptacidiphilus fuscans]MBF9072188.1 hypothetical protein [Streptacidiphilus fuscans]MBF9072999.1 hypothetical protein [Streptacidiphilus fuscans]
MATAHVDPRPRVRPDRPVVARGATKAERRPRNPIAACARGVGIVATTALSVVLLGRDGIPDASS